MSLLLYFKVSAGEKEKIIHEWDGLTRYLDAVMSRFFRIHHYEVRVIFLIIILHLFYY